MHESRGQEQQKEIFLKLVEAQDAGLSVEQSRRQMCETFAIALEELLDIEQQGRVHQWPPLE